MLNKGYRHEKIFRTSFAQFFFTLYLVQFKDAKETLIEKRLALPIWLKSCTCFSMVIIQTF